MFQESWCEQSQICHFIIWHQTWQQKNPGIDFKKMQLKLPAAAAAVAAAVSAAAAATGLFSFKAKFSSIAAIAAPNASNDSALVVTGNFLNVFNVFNAF